jgi:hypothetical protein
MVIKIQETSKEEVRESIIGINSGLIQKNIGISIIIYVVYEVL